MQLLKAKGLVHLPPLIQDLAFILVTAAAVAFIFLRLRQPVIVGYILAGALVGPHSFFPSLVSDLPNVRVWADLGVVFLMFHLGLEFSFRRFQRMGLSVGGVGIVEIGLMMVIGWIGARLLGYRGADPLFVAAMVAISSTTVIVKALDDLGMKTHRFAERVFGLLIFEDLAAVLLIVVIGSFAAGRALHGQALFYVMGELLLVVAGWYIVSVLYVPRFVRRVGQSQSDELLTLLSLGLCLLLAVTAARFHYSMALGAFIMGSVMAETHEAQRIARLVHPLRDLFVAVFFVSVGMLVDFSLLTDHFGVVMTLTLLVMMGKYASILFSSLLTGQNLRQSVKVSLAMGQIGEFSFIIAGLGIASGRMSRELQPAIVAVSIITSFLTPYMIRLSDQAARKIDEGLPPALKRRLANYGAWMESIGGGGRLIPRWLKPGLTRLCLNGLVVAIVFGGTNRYLRPLIQDSITDARLSRVATYLAAIALAAPFVFAMMTAARSTKTTGEESAREGALRAFFYFLFTIAWIGFLSVPYLSVWTSAAVSLILALLLALAFYRRLEFSYAWLERSFISGLSHEVPESQTARAMRELAPWDAHLSRLIVHPNAPIIGHPLRPLHATGLRQEYGLNIIAIRRGERVIGMPSSTEMILPGDELLVLGTDDQIDRARTVVENAATVDEISSADLSDYDLVAVRVTERSPFAGRTIQSSGLREIYDVMVVGVERDGGRILNPPPSFLISSGDLLWTVGLQERVQDLET